MTTTTAHPDIAPPLGASFIDIWEDDGQRDVYADIGTVYMAEQIERCPIVSTAARQDRDGNLSNVLIRLDDEDERVGLTAEQARELAAMLVRAADQADQWTSNGCSTCQHWDSCPRHPKRVR